MPGSPERPYGGGYTEHVKNKPKFPRPTWMSDTSLLPRTPPPLRSQPRTKKRSDDPGD